MIGSELLVAAALGVLGLAVAALAVLVVRLRRDRDQVDAQLAETRAESAALRARVEALAARPAEAEPARAAQEFVITDVGVRRQEPAPPARIEGRLFADVVLRESVVKAASLAHGLRRGLDPEVRNRIRFEVRREIKRARRQRRAELKEMRRERDQRLRAREVA